MTARTLPMAAELSAHAIAATPFLAQAAAWPDGSRIYAEIAAGLGAEHWEATAGAPVGETLPADLIAATVRALLHAGTPPAAPCFALMAAE